ncbi:MAG: enoyl-CoA hydratase/isomerase family protein [Pseudoxanthomonas sp.]
MDFSRYAALTFRRDGGVLHATLNRPETMNAIDDELDLELIRLFVEAADDAETRVVVLSGAGKAFSAGGDLDAIEHIIDNPQVMYDMVPRAKRLLNNLLDCPKPVIAKINGHAMGLGATLALFCDLTFAADHAKIADPHVKLGFVAGDGGAVIWPQLIGYARAKQYLLTGDAVSAIDAARIGLINDAVPAEQLDALVDEWARKLAALPPRAVQWTKLSINTGLRQVAAAGLDVGIAYETISNQTADHREALISARERRAGNYQGR